VGAEGAEVAGAGGIEGPVGIGFGPEVDLGIVVIGAAGEEVAVIDGFEIERGEEAGRGEFFAVGENVFVKAMMPIRISEEGFEIEGHGGTLGQSVTEGNCDSIYESMSRLESFRWTASRVWEPMTWAR